MCLEKEEEQKCDSRIHFRTDYFGRGENQAQDGIAKSQCRNQEWMESSWEGHVQEPAREKGKGQDAGEDPRPTESVGPASSS